MALAFACHAQSLNLGSGSSDPKPGDGLAALALADRLEDEAERLGDDDARRSIRELAADLLRAGENAGTPGGEAVLAGLTIAAKREELDRVVAGIHESTNLYIVDLIAQTERSILPREVDLLLRDALSPLHRTGAAACGWWLDGPEPTSQEISEHIAALDALIDSRRLTDAATDALTEMVAVLDRAREEPAFRRDVADWAALLTAAAGALDEPPDWLEMPARDQLRADFSSGVSMCIEKPAESREHLARTASLVRIVSSTRDLKDALQSRELRAAVNRLASAAQGDPKRDPAAVARIAETYARALDLIAAANRVPAPGELVRQCRPMIGPLTEAHDQAAAAVVRLLPTILNEPDPMTEPAVLAAMGSLQTLTDDLTIPVTLTTLLSTWVADLSRPAPVRTREPIATREMSPLAERVRQLGVSLSRDDEHDDALAELRGLAGQAAIARELPGERELRAGAQSATWRRVTGDQGARLVFLIDQWRTDWLRNLSADQFADRRDDDSVRLRSLAAVLPLLRDAAAIEELRTEWVRNIPPDINAWPGFELTGAGLDTLADGLTRDVAQLAALTARGDSDRQVLDRAGELRRRYAAALLVARLNALARPPCDAVAELGSGTATADAWLVGRRDALAAVSRSAYEAAAADGDRRESFLAHANRRAMTVLDAME